MSRNRQDFGQASEDLAATFLEQRGYRIVVRNFRLRQGEVDIVADDGTVLCFVEVKASRSFRYGDPIERVGPAKQRRLTLAARIFLARHPYLATTRDVRFDVISVHAAADADPSTWTLSHVTDAFRAG